jgi:hypothetical protein
VLKWCKICPDEGFGVPPPPAQESLGKNINMMCTCIHEYLCQYQYQFVGHECVGDASMCRCIHQHQCVGAFININV